MTTNYQITYEKVWMFPEYRRSSPGDSDFISAYAHMSGAGLRSDDMIADFGCGTGRALLRFQNAGHEVVGLDVAFNAMDEEPASRCRFVVHNLLDPVPDDICPDWGYCTDVMEHIEPDHLKQVLSNIHDAVRVGCYFKIFTHIDRFGPELVGHPLHVTLMTPEHWQQAIEAVFHTALTVRTGGSSVCIIALKEAPDGS